MISFGLTKTQSSRPSIAKDIPPPGSTPPAVKSEETRTPSSKRSDWRWVDKAFEGFALGMAGYSVQCVRVIKERQKRGLIGPEEANYLINKQCKEPDVFEEAQRKNRELLRDMKDLEPPPRDSLQAQRKCPFCGGDGTVVSKQGTFTVYKCWQRHIWGL